MNPNTHQEPTPDQEPDLDELPVHQPDEFEDVPLPRKVTRETDASSDKEDLNHGDEGIDDTPPQSDEMGD